MSKDTYKFYQLSSAEAYTEKEADKVRTTKTMDDINHQVDSLVELGELHEFREMLRRGAHLHHYPDDHSSLTETEKTAIINEKAKRWSQPFVLYFLVAIGALSAVAQGMDETVVNGAQLFFQAYYKISDSQIKQGLLNSSPYLAASLVGCWLAIPLNTYTGRRGTIFVSMAISVGASLWQGFCVHWLEMLGGRLLLGIGIGAASATVSVFTAESVPTPIRGGLTMFWQTFTAFGILLGYLVDVAFMGLDPSINWRIMMGSTFVVPLVVCCLVFLAPESPRWLVQNKKYKKAYLNLVRLRNTEVQAARDLFAIQQNLLEEQATKAQHNLVRELFTVPRNRRAAVAAWTLMFMQQLCGINIIMYYSSQIFVSAGISEEDSIYASLGAGVLNFLFAIPAIFLIDKAGRRPLLLYTFPLMSIFLLYSGLSFYASAGLRLPLIASGIYLFMIAYSPGEGPVPYTYAGEAFPQYVRNVGMSSATSLTWFCSFGLGFSFPYFLKVFTPTGAFGFYSAWCAIGWVLVFCLVPETKGLTLEQLDEVFRIPTRKHILYNLSCGKREPLLNNELKSPHLRNNMKDKKNDDTDTVGDV